MRVPASIALACLAALLGCGDDGTTPMRDGGPVIPPAHLDQLVAFEGQQRFITDLTAVGVDMSGASVAPDMSDGPNPMEVLEQRCNNARCAVVVRVRDDRPNMGIPIPAPIDAENAFLIVTTASGQRLRGLVSVRPLDTINNSGRTPITVRGTQLASSATSIPEAVFEGGAGGDPVRWVILGGGSLLGGIDVSGDGSTGRAGGADGGGPGASGAGPAGGEPGAGGAGAGGGGNLMAGGAGAGADGTPETGGAGGDAQPPSVPCLGRFTESACGGSGGGGAAGAGGAGGGSILIASLAPLDLGGAMLSARGADGVDGGGGGSGGHILLAAPSWTAPASRDVAGGAGGVPSAGGAGGAGSPGVLRIDVPGERPADAIVGPVVDLSAVSAIQAGPTATLTGTAEVGATVRVTDTDGLELARGEATDGTFSIDVPLTAGLNRMRVESTGPSGTLTGWTGTSLDFVQVDAMSFPSAAVIDVAYVPDSE